MDLVFAIRNDWNGSQQCGMDADGARLTSNRSKTDDNDIKAVVD